MKINQKGVAHILLLIAAIGLIIFILVSASSDFKDNLFKQLFPKPASQANTYVGEIVVGPNEVVKTINGAVASASANYLIRIHAGTYPEQVEVNKQVTIQAFGDGEVWVDGGNSRAVGMNITASDVVIDGIGIKNTAAQGVLIGGINAKNITIQNSTIQDFDMAGTTTFQANAGIAAWYAGSGMKILNNTIIRRSAGSLTGGLSNGIWFKSSSTEQSGGGHLISGNTIKGGYDGIGGEVEDDIHGSFDKDTVIEKNIIDTCFDDGIQVEGGNQNIKVRNNDIQRCAIGIATAPNLVGPIYIEYNKITNGVPGFYNMMACFKTGNNGTGVAYYTGNTCILPPTGSITADGWKQTNANQNTIISNNNKIHVSRYVAEITTWTNPTQQTGTSFDNDCLYTSDPTRFVKWSTGTYTSLTAWKTATGLEANGIQTQNCPDPVDPTGGTATPLPSSTPVPDTSPTTSPVNPTAKFLLYKGTSSSFSVGSTIPVMVLAITDTDSANLFAAKISFDPTKLKAVSIDNTNSFVSSWAEQFIDNTNGKLSLTGGVPTPGFKTSNQYALMTTVNFEALSPVTNTALNFDSGSQIFRDSDNANILLSSTGTSMSITAPVPTPAPTAVPTAIPTPTPTPTSTPTATPIPTPSPTPSPVPVICQLVSAFWNSSNVVEGSIVTLTAVGTSGCSDTDSISFDIRENNTNLPDTDISPDPSNINFNSINKTWTATWVAQYQEDALDLLSSEGPEYFFNAIITGRNTIRSADPLLSVTQSGQGGPISTLKGDGNLDNQVNLVDLSMLFSYYCNIQTSCKRNLPANLDFNDDGLVNTVDFANMVSVLLQNGIVRQ